jgi:GT2 family glycosyltransferase
MPPPVHVLLPVHNRREITRQCIEQLLVQTYRQFSLVVVDDGSTDATAGMVGELAPQATVLRGDGNLWWAGSLQLAVDHLTKSGAADGDIVLFLNDDTVFDRNFIENGVAALEDSPGSMLLAQGYSLQTGKFVEVGVRADWASLRFESASDIDQANCLSTRGLFMRLGIVRRIGGFRPLLLPHYLSDYEFTIRALRNGVSAVTDSSVRLFMNESTTGVRIPDKRSPGAYLRSVITRRSTANPFYWSSFLILACPARHLARNLVRVWLGFMREFRETMRTRQTSQ